ncbi:tRNA lysidine(34) synthetase TilS [Sphingomonas quercus]|uniref:tRNA lysidine(34) synthetase TilS n=1 Tax=Sphingomonas quercus TaxID=2842451 RepID=UPI0034418195
MPSAGPEGKGPAAAGRFRADLAKLTDADRLGVAVSGGPDSVALLLLARAALPGRVEAATVDHGLRAEAAEEARFVAKLCAALDVPHATLAVTVEADGGSVQAAARAVRYAALAGWAAAHGLPAIATAHHADDQAETLLLRLARGAGLAGLAGVRPRRAVATSLRSRRASRDAAGGDSGTIPIVRPLLGWRKAELIAIVASAGIIAVADPSNADPRYDRTAARALLAGTDWLDADRLARAAANLAEAEDALEWTADRLWAERAAVSPAGIAFDPAGLPAELRRRLLLRALTALGAAPPPRGPALARFAAALESGETATLAGIRAEGGKLWHFAIAPPRRGH